PLAAVWYSIILAAKSLTSWRVACSCARRAASISNRLLEAARSAKPCGVEGSGAAVAVSSAASVSSVWLSTASPPQAVRASAAAARSANRRVIGHVLSLGGAHATGQQAARYLMCRILAEFQGCSGPSNGLRSVQPQPLRCSAPICSVIVNG